MCIGLISCRDAVTTPEAVDPQEENKTAIEPPSPLDHFVTGFDEFGPAVNNRNADYGFLSSSVASTIQGIGSLGGSDSFAFDNNDQGQVVGYSQTSSGAFHAFLWEASTGMVDLGTLGGSRSVAYGINVLGQVVGYSTTASGEFHAFIWDDAGGMVDLGTLSGTESVAFDINDHGQVVGYSNTTFSFISRAFLWEAGAGMTDLGTLGGAQSFAYGINNKGQVVGRSQNTSGQEPAFLWEAGVGMVDLGTLGGSWSYAYDINEQEQVVGYSLIPSDLAVHAFLWEASGGMVDLGTLGGSFSEAFDINDQGQVVGRSQTSTGRYRGFLWDASDGMVDLGDLGTPGLPYSWAHSINNNGQIAGASRIVPGPWQAVIWSAQADDTPPEIIYTLETESLWPPNHKMVPAVTGIAAVDDVDGPVTPIVTVASNEDTNGKGDGNTSPDWAIADNGDGTFDVYLRAERSGRRSGRVYTVTITATDASGNPAEEIVEVNVPHDQRGRRR
ncbi:MAG: hypothetical protein R3224_07425 [Balneolaceae bacterium]|nr:hypothetical protein [Balneolaceae bacterium]